LKAERERSGRAENDWKDAKTNFEQTAGNAYFTYLRHEADRFIVRLKEADAEEAQRLRDLANRKRELQLRRYFEQHDIDHAKIKGIGTARKLTLKSFGIETAADVERSRILAINGFGPAKADSLQDWRRQLEASFRFDPNRAINPADVAAIKNEIGKRRADLRARVQQTIVRLEKARSDAIALRSNPGSQATDAWIAVKRAEQFERELRPSAREVIQLLGVTVTCIAAVFILAALAYLPSGSRIRGNATSPVFRASVVWLVHPEARAPRSI
jgi:DNA-binding helix-hairpin-helix protein with protein kinase domain